MTHSLTLITSVSCDVPTQSPRRLGETGTKGGRGADSESRDILLVARLITDFGCPSDLMKCNVIFLVSASISDSDFVLLPGVSSHQQQPSMKLKMIKFWSIGTFLLFFFPFISFQNNITFLGFNVMVDSIVCTFFLGGITLKVPSGATLTQQHFYC